MAEKAVAGRAYGPVAYLPGIEAKHVDWVR